MKTFYFFLLTVISIAVFFCNIIFIAELGALVYFILMIVSSYGMITGLKYFAESDLRFGKIYFHIRYGKRYYHQYTVKYSISEDEDIYGKYYSHRFIKIYDDEDLNLDLDDDEYVSDYLFSYEDKYILIPFLWFCKPLRRINV